LAILGAISPHFKSYNGEIGHEGVGLEHKIWSKSFKGPAGIALPHRGDAY